MHLIALDGHGAAANTREMAEDVTRATSTALALVQGIVDAGATPTEGVWFITRGAQVLERDFIRKESGELAGATLWGLGKVMFREAAHLQPRLIDMEPTSGETATTCLVDELMFPDPETHVAYRGGSRHAARLVRGGAGDARLALPEGAEWVIGPDDPEAGLATLRAKPRRRPALRSAEVRVAVEAMGLNFADVLLSMGAVESNLDLEIGREMYGRVLETAQDVEGLSVGDPVVGMGFGSFTPEMVTRAVMLAPFPPGTPGLLSPPCPSASSLPNSLSSWQGSRAASACSSTPEPGVSALPPFNWPTPPARKCLRPRVHRSRHFSTPSAFVTSSTAGRPGLVKRS